MALSGDEFSLRIEDFLQQAGGCAVIDGGLATELERHGADLNDPLWSAKCLISSPHLIRQVHLDYLEAGADVLITASYQATIQGFESKGLSKVEAEALLEKSVQIACEARDEFMRRCISGVYEANGDQHTPKPHHILVAASVGSYGAYLADGSEYSGQYGDSITLEVLKDFHRRRVQVLANSGADLIAFETIPNKIEAQAYVELLEEGDVKIPAWLSFNSKDGVNVVSGDSLAECISIGDSCQKVVAVGINCTPPRFIHDLVISVEKVTKKPVLIYPNSGEMYDAEKKQWVESTGVSDDDFVPYVCNWREAGASLIGGCCRTTPNTIRAICRALNKMPFLRDVQRSHLFKSGVPSNLFPTRRHGEGSLNGSSDGVERNLSVNTKTESLLAPQQEVYYHCKLDPSFVPLRPKPMIEPMVMAFLARF